jgi:ABC-2 type transport system ATP-binding protein
MDYAIYTEGLTKSYGAVRAVDGVNLRVRSGEIYGFLGLNGAGKTTTIRTLLGMIHPTAGRVEVWYPSIKWWREGNGIGAACRGVWGG